MKRGTFIVIYLLISNIIISQNNHQFIIKNININNKDSNSSISFYDEDFVVYSTVKEFKPMSKKDARLAKKNGITSKNDLDFYFGVTDQYGNISSNLKLSDPINSDQHEVDLVFTKNLKTVYFTKNTNISGNEHLELYTATVLGPNSWINIKKLPFSTGQHSFSSPCLSDDDQTLYFTSNMKGTMGDFDIFKVSILGNNHYGKPKNLGPKINTRGKETTPFIQNNILYFSSNSRSGKGGLDIFSVPLDNLNNIKNLDSPINSNSDDYGFIIDADNSGFFISNKLNGKGKEDIYYFKAFNENETDKISAFLDYEVLAKSEKEISLGDSPEKSTKIQYSNNSEIINEIQNIKDEIAAFNALKNRSSNSDDVRIYKKEIMNMRKEITELNMVIKELKDNSDVQSTLEIMKQEIASLKKDREKDILMQKELAIMKDEIALLKRNNEVLNSKLKSYEAEYNNDLADNSNGPSSKIIYTDSTKEELIRKTTKAIIDNEIKSTNLINAINRFNNPTNNKSAFIYKDERLNIATNLNYLDQVPVYPGCEGIFDEKERKSCLITKVSTFSNENFNTKVIKKPKKGFNYIRVIFLVDKNGNSEAVKITGDWKEPVRNEVKRVIAALPKMIPGKLNNESKMIKYSFRIPFIIK